MPRSPTDRDESKSIMPMMSMDSDGDGDEEPASWDDIKELFSQCEKLDNELMALDNEDSVVEEDEVISPDEAKNHLSYMVEDYVAVDAVMNRSKVDAKLMELSVDFAPADCSRRQEGTVLLLNMLGVPWHQYQDKMEEYN